MDNDVLKFYREAVDRLGAKDSYTSAEISAILLGLLLHYKGENNGYG